MTPKLPVLLVAAGALLAQGTLAVAQAPYPTKPIRMIVPVAPGGGGDITCRTIAQKLTELWGRRQADHLAGELFNRMAGVQMQHVPYKGGAPAMIDLVAGNVQLIFATVSTAVGQMKAGRIRTIALTSAKRSDLMPEVPTVAESGVPGFAVENWYGFVVPAGTPKPIISQLHREINRVLVMPDVRDRLYTLGIVAFPTATPEEFGAYARSETRKYAELVKAVGIVAD